MPDGSDPQYDVGYSSGPQSAPDYSSLSGYAPSSAGSGGYGGGYGYSSGGGFNPGGLYNMGARGGFMGPAQGTAGIGMGIYDLLSGNSQNQYQQLMNMPYLQGNIATMQGLTNQLQNAQLPAYASQAASNAAQRANAINGIQGPLAASVNAQNQTRAQQMFDQWRVGALMQASGQLGQLQAAQYQRDAALRAGQMNAQNQDWSSILGGFAGMGDSGLQALMAYLSGGGGGGLTSMAAAL